jgi:hypothetical protein
VNATRARRRPARRLLLVLVASGLVPLVTSCSFGTSNFDAQTNQVYTPAEGVSDRSGAVDVLNALVVSDQDGRGRFIAGLVNNSKTTDDALTGVQGAGDSSAVHGTLTTPVDVAADAFVQLADQGVEPVVLEGDPIVAGHFIDLTVSFQKSQEVTIQVPVVTAEDDYKDVKIPTASATP